MLTCGIINVHKFFSEHILPKSTTELYQICYISGENELHGASTPFQFTVENLQQIHAPPIPFLTGMKSCMIKSKSSKTSEKDDLKRENELEDLREENSLLKAAIKALISQKNDNGKNYDEDIAQLKEITDSLKTAMNQQQQEMNILKMKIKKCGEEYKKLYLEKIHLEKKLQKEEIDKANKCPNQVIKTGLPMQDFDISNLPSIPPFPMQK